jgi:hypothetical protein
MGDDATSGKGSFCALLLFSSAKGRSRVQRREVWTSQRQRTTRRGGHFAFKTLRRTNANLISSRALEEKKRRMKITLLVAEERLFVCLSLSRLVFFFLASISSRFSEFKTAHNDLRRPLRDLQPARGRLPPHERRLQSLRRADDGDASVEQWTVDVFFFAVRVRPLRRGEAPRRAPGGKAGELRAP